jgi:hypothetical protein
MADDPNRSIRDSLNGTKTATAIQRSSEYPLVARTRDFRALEPENLLRHAEISDSSLLSTVWGEVFERDRLTAADIEWYRLIVGWRITKEMSRIMGICEDDETLTEALTDLKSTKSVWESYVGKTPSLSQISAWDAHIGSKMRDLDLGLAPPEDPERLAVWVEIIQTIGGEITSEIGMLGMRFLPDCWPRRENILLFEAHLVAETLEEIQRSGGSRNARKHLIDKYEFSATESWALVSAAQREAIVLVGNEDVSQARALMVLQLEEFAQRAKENLDPRSELMALKLKAAIQGITQSEPEDVVSSFTRAIKNVAGESKSPPRPVMIDVNRTG